MYIPGPQDDQIPRAFTVDVISPNQSLAQLGFVVINVDKEEVCTGYRGRDFHCFGYGNLEKKVSIGGLINMRSDTCPPLSIYRSRP